MHRLPRFTKEALINTLDASVGICWGRSKIAATVDHLWPKNNPRCITAKSLASLMYREVDNEREEVCGMRVLDVERAICHMLPHGFRGCDDGADVYYAKGICFGDDLKDEILTKYVLPLRNYS